MNDVKRQIEHILNKPESPEQDLPGKCQEIEYLIDVYTWDTVQSILLDILAEPHRTLFEKDTIAQVIWGAVLDKRKIPINKTIALLYACHPEQEPDLLNLVWSITAKLKGLSYLSDYEPLADEDIMKEIQKHIDSNDF